MPSSTAGLSRRQRAQQRQLERRVAAEYVFVDHDHHGRVYRGQEGLRRARNLAWLRSPAAARHRARHPVLSGTIPAPHVRDFQTQTADVVEDMGGMQAEDFNFDNDWQSDSDDSERATIDDLRRGMTNVSFDDIDIVRTTTNSASVVRYRQLLQAQEQAWKELRPTLFAAYMKNVEITSNFSEDVLGIDTGDKVRYQFCKNDCLGGLENLGIAKLRCVNLHRQYQLHFEYCTCRGLLQSLAAAGFLAATPKRPSTVFTFKFLEFREIMWRTSPHSVESWATGISKFHFGQKGTLMGRYRNDVNFRRTFTQAIDVYRDLVAQKVALVHRIMEDNEKSKMAHSCPACFGPRPEVGDSGYDIMICLDGNFQHSRPRAAAKYDFAPRHPPIFLSTTLLDDMRREVEAADSTVSVTNTCTDSWTAARGGAKQWKGNKETGLIACVCRHDVALKLANLLESGEKFHYPLALLKFILDDVDDKARVGVLYDVACNLELHVKKRKLLHEHMQRGRIGMALSVFHAFAHNWPCQMKFNPRLISGFGLTDGEGCERLWSALRPLIRLNRQATSSHRLSNIASMIDSINDDRKASLITWLSRKLLKACEMRRTARKRLAKLPSEYTKEFLKDMWERQVRMEEIGMRHSLTRKRRERARKIGQLYEAKEALSSITQSLQTSMLTRDGPSMLTRFDEYLKQIALVENLSVSQDIETSSSEAGGTEGTHDAGVIRARLNGQRKKIAKLRELYNKLVIEFISKFRPAHPPLEAPELSVLETLEPTDPFWQTGLFDFPDEPWATNPIIKEGIAWWLQEQRADEEKKRLQCELIRILRWTELRKQQIESAINEWERVLAWVRTENNGNIGSMLIENLSLRGVDDESVCKITLTLLEEERSLHKRVEILWFRQHITKLWESLACATAWPELQGRLPPAIIRMQAGSHQAELASRITVESLETQMEEAAESAEEEDEELELDNEESNVTAELAAEEVSEDESEEEIQENSSDEVSEDSNPHLNDNW